MPSDPRKWQACRFGLRDHSNRTAIPGCQSDGNYGGARKYVSYDKCVQYSRDVIDAIAGDLSPGLQRLYALDHCVRINRCSTSLQIMAGT